MTDHAEEQEMEAEALAAIFDTHFNILPSSSGDAPLRWQVEIYPEMTADADELDEVNHVAARLVVELPADYPERLPVLACELIKGLVEDHRVELLALAQEEAIANEGAPCIFAVVERLREWLADNNQKGLDDLSMHAQMIRKQQAKEKEKLAAEATIFESQEEKHEFTATEMSEMAVQKRRAEGTPCTLDNFEVWKARFEAEMAEAAVAEDEKDETKAAGGAKRVKKQGSLVTDKSGRISGFDYFRSKAGSMEALEAAAEAAAEQEMEEGEEDEDLPDVDEDLFEDDVDLDDLDFDSDEDEDVDI